jgi:glucosyl-3-phosphoglycerate phosphatase
MTAGRLVVWRHGRTSWNHEDRFQGQSDIPLDEVGVTQAAAAAARLVAYSPAAIVSSDLSRAAQTADALASLTGLTVTYDPDLREIDVGSWAGLLASEIRAAYPGVQARLDTDPTFRRGGDGETLAEVAERTEKALWRALDLVADGETVIAASHGLAGRLGVARFLGLSHEQWGVLGGLRNCGWITLQSLRRGWCMTEWNA